MSYNYDPELKDIVPMLPDFPIDDVDSCRKAIDKLIAGFNAEVDTQGLEVSDKAIPGFLSAPDVTVRHYCPAGINATDEPSAALIYIHGGGFIMGSINSEHAGAASLASRLGVQVFSVEYRLAPENPYPAGLLDCYAALLWVADRASMLGVNPERIGVCGASAGGGLAAALCLYAKEQQGPAICFQCLDMPELDDRLLTASMQQFVDTPMWNRSKAEVSWRYYLGDSYTPGGNDVPITAAPARALATDLSGLPPAYISAMEFDPLRDEAIEYGLKLLQAGVPVQLVSYPGTFHGSSLVENAAVSKRADRDCLEALRRALVV